jgi:CRISPR-associated protein Csx16
MSTRIVTFLGLGKQEKPHYTQCRYRLDGTVTQDPTAIHDAVTVVNCSSAPTSLLVLGTEEVRRRWFDGGQLYRTLLEQALPADLARPALGFRPLPDGKTDEERWRIFSDVAAALSHDPLALHDPATGRAETEASPPSTIILDITHGFRSQPFFAASAVQFVRSQLKRVWTAVSGPELRILYAAFEAREPFEAAEQAIAPVWDLTQFVEVLDWNSAIDGLMRYGRADDLQALLGALQRRIVRESRGCGIPKLKQLGDAAKELADALVTARVPALLTSVADRLRRAVAEARDDVLRHVPPLAPQLDELEDWVRPMTAGKPVSPGGLRACLSLARVYRQTERYSELSSLLREVLVSAFTLRHGDADVKQPGAGNEGFGEQRDAMEDCLKALSRDYRSADPLARLFNQVGDLRNDVMHSGFRTGPRGAQRIRSDLDPKLADIRTCLAQLGLMARTTEAAPPMPEPTTYLVTRHPGAREWAEQEGIAVDRVVDHLDVGQIRDGDVVIGSLPVNLAAEVCARGGRYLHLSLHLPPELRGKELTVEDMRRLGARVEEHVVSRKGQRWG